MSAPHKLSYLLPSLVLLSALSIAATAAYFSIVGLTALFPGALGPIILMGTVLECGKLIAATWLHHNWTKCPRLMRYYLTFAVIILMGITSIGIFGFLAKSHLEHQKGALQEQAIIEQLNDKIKSLRLFGLSVNALIKASIFKKDLLLGIS